MAAIITMAGTTITMVGTITTKLPYDDLPTSVEIEELAETPIKY